MDSSRIVSFADVVATHQAILSELHGVRLDMEDLRADVKKILLALTDLSVNLTTRVERLEIKEERQGAVCRYHHPGNGYSPSGLGDGAE